MTAPLVDLFGQELEVLGTCPSCGAPRTRPKGTTHGPTWVHRDGCLRPPKLGDHMEAREWTEQSIERDYVEARDRGDFRV
jgi:hypothetical protein